MGASNLQILVADDDPDILEGVATTLEALGATVTRAATGAELMAHLGETGLFDLVITDIAMPWMTGLQAMHSTRYAGLRTPVIVMTALSAPEIPARVQALGASARLLRKPFGMADLAREIADLIPGAIVSRAAS
jgi:CheY-like chemotaxis protein